MLSLLTLAFHEFNSRHSHIINRNKWVNYRHSTCIFIYFLHILLSLYQRSLSISIQGVHLFKGRILFHNLHLQVINITCYYSCTSSPHQISECVTFTRSDTNTCFFMYSDQCTVPPINQSGHMLHKQLQTYMQWGWLLQVSKHAT